MIKQMYNNHEAIMHANNQLLDQVISKANIDRGKEQMENGPKEAQGRIKYRSDFCRVRFKPELSVSNRRQRRSDRRYERTLVCLIKSVHCANMRQKELVKEASVQTHTFLRNKPEFEGDTLVHRNACRRAVFPAVEKACLS